ncbi:hypothetical protein QC762_0035940 [Podospora pseudocomata]|uniref:Uncharacterized protein n=1 Tax=Podospora pseudocomata TaxID=2093779 RepID=A0ABR0GR13_9PEZI|nr:hypothetical protein QC762_0035940 [Podospora pseudocomata]
MPSRAGSYCSSALAVFDSYCHLSPQAAPTQTAMFPPAENRPLFSSEFETTTTTEVLTVGLTTGEVDTSESVTAASSYEARVTGGGGGEGVCWCSRDRGRGRFCQVQVGRSLLPYSFG